MTADHLSKLVGVGAIASMLGLSPSGVRYLADTGLIPSVRTAGGHRRFDPAAVLVDWERHTVRLPRETEERSTLFSSRYSTTGLEEHVVWREVNELLNLSTDTPACGVLHYVLTEIVNNAIEHAGGSTVDVTLAVDDALTEVTVADDGVGIFANLRAHLDLPDDASAVLELTKGKRTTDPERHTGEGIFFSSRAVQTFLVAANGIEWIVDNHRGDEAVGSSGVVKGTTVTFSLPKTGGREIEAVFAEFTDEGHRFNRSRPSVKLAEIGTLFISRSEARRLMQGLEKFSEVELDFAGVTRVGQGFADEVFRVWQASHPSTRLVPVRTIAPVAFMIERSADFPPR